MKLNHPAANEKYFFVTFAIPASLATFAFCFLAVAFFIIAEFSALFYVPTITALLSTLNQIIALK